MWLLGVVGVAAGLVAAIYLYEVLSSTFVSGGQNEDKEAARRTGELQQHWMDEASKDADGTETP